MPAYIVVVFDLIISFLLQLFLFYFASTQVEQSSALGLSTFVMPYCLDNNMVLPALLSTCANLLCHSWVADLYELYLWPVGRSKFFTAATLAAGPFDFILLLLRTDHPFLSHIFWQISCCLFRPL